MESDERGMELGTRGWSREPSSPRRAGLGKEPFAPLFPRDSSQSRETQTSLARVRDNVAYE